MQNSPSHHPQGFPPRQGSLNSSPRPYPGIGVYAGVGAQPKSILQNARVNSPPSSLNGRPSLQSPPPRSTSVPDPHAGPGLRIAPHAHAAGTFTAPPTPTEQHPNGFMNSPLDPPNSAPPMAHDYASQQIQIQQPLPQAFPDKPRFTLTDGGPASAPSMPTIRRAVSESNFHSEGESPLSSGLTPPGRRVGRESRVPSSPSKYNTFEDMGIQGKSQAQAQAEDKECVIM